MPERPNQADARVVWSRPAPRWEGRGLARCAARALAAGLDRPERLVRCPAALPAIRGCNAPGHTDEPVLRDGVRCARARTNHAGDRRYVHNLPTIRSTSFDFDMSGSDRHHAPASGQIGQSLHRHVGGQAEARRRAGDNRYLPVRLWHALHRVCPHCTWYMEDWAVRQRLACQAVASMRLPYGPLDSAGS